MTETVEIFDSNAPARVPDHIDFFYYDDKMRAVLMKSPLGGWSVFRDVEELGDAVDELGDAVEQAKDKGVTEYESLVPEDIDEWQ